MPNPTPLNLAIRGKTPKLISEWFDGTIYFYFLNATYKLLLNVNIVRVKT